MGLPSCREAKVIESISKFAYIIEQPIAERAVSKMFLPDLVGIASESKNGYNSLGQDSLQRLD